MAAYKGDRDNELDKCIDYTRASISLWSLCLVLYLPFGLLLLVFRLCLVPQALLLMLIIPEGTIKRFLLRIFFTVMGLVVVNRNFERRSKSTRMLICNKVSHIDYIPLHLALDCTTSSVDGLKPMFSMLFYHHTFPYSNTTDISNKLKKIPEFDDQSSIPDSVAVPFVAQPEALPTNGKGVLKFSDWPFTVEKVVQPLAMSSWRPLNIKTTTVSSSELSDLLWTLFSPVTVFTFQMLPVVDSREDITLEQFAKKAQDKIADCLGIISTQKTSDDISKWKDNFQRKRERTQTTIVRASGPIITESDFSKVKASSEIDRMVQQVLAVLPDAPLHAIRKDLMETRSVDATLTKFLDGRIEEVNESAEVSYQTNVKQPFSMQECHTIYNTRRRQMIEEARRRYLTKQGRTK